MKNYFIQKVISMLLIFLLLIMGCTPAVIAADIVNDGQAQENDNGSINKGEAQVSLAKGSNSENSVADRVYQEKSYNGESNQSSKTLVTTKINTGGQTNNGKKPVSVTKSVYDTETNFPDPELTTDHFIIKFKDEKTGENFRNTLKDDIKGFREVKSSKAKNFEVITTQEKMKPADFITKVKNKKADSNIEYIQPDYKLKLSSDDTYFEEQWGLYNNNQIISNQSLSTSTIQNAVYGSVYQSVYSNNSTQFRIDVNVVDAWKQSQGDGVIVAVLDTGIDITNEDLKDNIWVNTKEIEKNGEDDDRDGYVDDVNGWNFYDDNNQVHVDNPTHSEWHGTHIAGIIAAQMNNKIGIAGVAPKAKIMPLKVFGPDGAYTSDIIEAIEYAEQHGAKIVNCSWGTTESNPALQEAIEKSGMLFICAAGNGSTDIDINPVYPAAYPNSNIISVASIDSNGALSNFSNYGEKSVDVAAPGELIMSSVSGNKYMEMSGTSMSAGFVSGEAALLLGKEKGLTVSDVKERIINSSDHLSSLTNKVYGSGKINVTDALVNKTWDKSVVWDVYNGGNSLSSGKIQENGYQLYNNGDYYISYYLASDGEDDEYNIQIPNATSIRVHFAQIRNDYEPYGNYVFTSAGDAWGLTTFDAWSKWANGSSIQITGDGEMYFEIDMVEYMGDVLTDDYPGGKMDASDLIDGDIKSGCIDYQSDVDMFVYYVDNDSYTFQIKCTSSDYVQLSLIEPNKYLDGKDVVDYSDNTSYGDISFEETLESGIPYYIKVEGIPGAKYTLSFMGPNAHPAVPVLTYSNNTLFWNAIDGATGYEIYDNGNTVTINGGTTTQYKVSLANQIPGTVCRYFVRVVGYSSGLYDGRWYGWSNTVTVDIPLNNPSAFSWSPLTSTGTTINWNKNGNTSIAEYRVILTIPGADGNDEVYLADSDWQTNISSWTFSGLAPNTPYRGCIQVRSQDQDHFSTGWIDCGVKYTLANVPSSPAWKGIDNNTSTLIVSWLQNGNPLSTQYHVILKDRLNENVIADTGWQTNINTWTFTGLKLNKSYHEYIQARNGDNVETDWLDCGLVNVPFPKNIQYHYDSNSRLEEILTKDGVVLIKFEYDKGGNLAKKYYVNP